MLSNIILIVFVLSIQLCSSNNVIEVYSISTFATFQSSTGFSGTFGQSIIASQKIAFNEINNRSDILPNITLQLIETEDCGNNKLVALGNAINIAQQSSSTCNSNTNNDPNTAVSAIVLCCPWSVFSEITAPVFSKFNYIQISTSSTATSLSGVASFYRMMSNVEVVAKAYIPLCKHFGWNRIGIVYIDDIYGINLKDEIQNEAEAANISVKSHSFSYSIDTETGTKSMKATADFIRDNELFITIIVASSGDVQHVMSSFKDNGILQYPYYFIFRSTPNALEIQDKSVNLQGFITVQPMYPSLLSQSEYSKFNVYDGNISIYNQSDEIYSNIKEAWSELYKSNPSIVYNRAEPHDYTTWAYDVAYTVAYTLHDLIEQGFDLFNINFNDSSVVDVMKEYLTKRLRFIGASGLIQLDENGNRIHGYYLYGYIDNNSHLVPFGAYTGDDDVSTNDITDTAVFPYYFNGKIPLSSPQLKITTISVSNNWYIAVLILCAIFIAFTVLCIILILKERQHPIIKKSSYKLSIFICCGAILGFIHLMLQRIGDFGCITSKYGRGIVITLLFIPVFARLYRLHHIMNMNKKRYVGFDEIKKFERTFIKTGIWAMIFIDIILFVTVTLFHRTISGNILSLDFVYDDAKRSSTDLLIITQNKYEVCIEKNVKIATIFSVILIIYKCTQFVFGLYFTFSAFRNNFKWKYVTKNSDEMFMVLVSIILSVLILLVLITYLLVASNTDNLQLTYCLYSLLIILIILVIMIGNVLPRLYFRYKTSATDIYKRNSPEEIMIHAQETVTSTSITSVNSESTLEINNESDTSTGKTQTSHKDSYQHDLSIVTEEPDNNA